MDIQAEKIELVKLLLETEDTALLNDIKALFQSHEKDFWSTLPRHVKDGIGRGKQQARNGQVVPHEEAMRKYGKYL